MIEISEYFEIDWKATGSRLKTLLLDQVWMTSASSTHFSMT